MECILENDDGTKAVVMCGHEKKTFKSSEIGQVNPPKFEQCEDMANLTFLNDASVFWNLKVRFCAKLIYTYSGLFCIVVNPYKRYPIYTGTVVKMYLGKRKNEVPPHLWAITETAYRNMLTNSKDQSMLITGESGAGKTENTKKVISYLAAVAAPKKKAGADTKKVSLEDQIVATNPILESYGNAKTSRNDNSSRFGKFIRIHFNAAGKLAGCDIESYLLEKSRITQQQEVERSYHIFYQLLQPHVPTMKAECMVSDDIYDYIYVSQGKVTVASIDDNEELEMTDAAFDIIGFSHQEKWDCYKITAGVMSSGQIEFVQKGRDDQAEPGDLNYPTKVAACFGVDVHQYLKAFCKPKIKVGAEWVTKGQTCDQATSGVGGIARAIFDRIFKWLIIKCNETLIDPTMKKANFCAVLDLAGFEIFEYNGFEQISINFVNEKLQQFFNHTMFVVEQEEYVAEGVEWAPVDFGMDAAACITMFEKPMGIWAILQEETLFPKATDKSFADKLQAGLGKFPNFMKPQSKTDPNAHFACSHYAGIVSYNVTAWLEKNADPVNDTVVDVLKQGSNALMVYLWREHPGQSNPPEEDKTKKKKKGGGGKTVSSVYLVQLGELMSILHATEPHFIRCIVPNTHKQPLMVETVLIMQQLTCNGVLEGIRVCMLGFPNRMLYPDFKMRYAILGAAEIASSSDNKVAVNALMAKVEFPTAKFQLGHTKVFFRAGALAALEEARDGVVLKLVRWMQGQCYGHIRRGAYQKKYDQRELMKVCQRNFRKYQGLRDWGWFILIQKTKPLIGRVDLEQELKLLEEKANDAYGAYLEQVNNKARMEQDNVTMEDEKKALLAQLQAEQGNLGEYTERQAKASAAKADLEVQLADAGDKLITMEEQRQQAGLDKKALEADNLIIKKDIGDLELAIQKLEQEKTNRNHVIRHLNDEIASTDEIIAKLNKEKKHMSDNASKSVEDLQGAEEKVDHLNKIKSRLESTLDELNNSLGNEKRGRIDVEKARRRVEGELKISQEAVADLERQKKEGEAAIGRKEREITVFSTKLSDEQNLVAKIQHSIKDVSLRVEEAEEELEAERQARAKAERQKSDLARELESLGERLNEAGGATHAQVELNKKRDAEVQKLRKDLEEANIQHEATLIGLKKKHQDAVSEMSEQIEQLSAMKGRIEKDKSMLMHEVQDVRSATEEIIRSKASAEKSTKNLITALNDVNKKVEEANLTIGDFENAKRKLAAENADLLRQLQEHENQANMLSKYKVQFQSALEEAKRVADNEGKDRQSLLGKFKNLEHEVDGHKEKLEEKCTEKDDILRQLSKATQEANMWMKKFETEGLAKAEDIEMNKMKIAARLTEAEVIIDQLTAKAATLDMAKEKVQADIDDMSAQTDQAQILNNSMEKKAEQFDKVVSDWKLKAESLSMDLDTAQKDCRNASSELFRIKNAYEESVLQLDDVRKENKLLSNEIKDIMDQISEGGRSIHEIDKIRKRLEAEKMELQAALEQAEGALEQEENKVLRAQLELNAVRQEIERRLAEKEEEFLLVKKAQSKALDSMQVALETETKSKAEALRMKKKLEGDAADLGLALEHAIAGNAETQTTIKKYALQVRDAQLKVDEESAAKSAAADAKVTADRRAAAMANGLEEARALLETADRQRRAAEQELADTNETLADLTNVNQSITASKRKLEVELGQLNADLDEMTNEAKMSEDKAARAMVDAARLADELRCEQELAMNLEKDKKLLEAQCKDAATRADEAEVNALKGGRKAMIKMETRIRELESELDAETRRFGDVTKNLRKSERSIKELTFACDEDRKNHERMQSLIDQLQGKVKSYKKQIEEAEEIAALNLAKYRKVAGALGDAEASAAEQEAAMRKARARSASLV